jgi:hypothetical protein
MADIAYQRLTRARTRFAIASGSRASLWLGPDHLLYIESNGYAETYKRFYFRDIQAFILQQTTTARNVNIIALALALMFLLFALLTESTGVKIAWSIVAGVFGLMLLVNAIPGPSCKCFIRTAVQTEELFALGRVRKARKVLGRIRPLINEVQGGALPPESIPARLHELEGAMAVTPPPKMVAEVLPGVPPRLEP